MDPLHMLADRLDPPKLDVFPTLQFWANCKVRNDAALEIGYPHATAAELAGQGHRLPPFCGTCPQERFLDSFDDPHTDTLYGGAAGGGKSASLLMGAMRSCANWPGLQAFWFRRSFPELQQSVLRALARVGYGKKLGCGWNASRHELSFVNGSILTFAHAKNLQEATALQSAEIQLLILDERTTIPPDVVDFIYTRVRSGQDGVPELGIRSGTNPGDIGHSRVKTEYVEATSHGAEIIVDALGRTRRFIQAKVSDTPQLGPEYARALAGMGGQLAKAFLEGDWDVFAGQVFSEWRYARHVVPRFTIPPEWRRLAGIDYGYAAPWCTLWAAVDNDGRVWVYRERYEKQVGETEQARRILADEAEEPKDRGIGRFADPSMWRTTGEGLPIASVYAQNNVGLSPANNERIAGWQRVHTYLADGPACRYHREQGWDTCPRLHVLDGTAPNLVRTLPAVPYDKLKVEDVDTHSEDHAADALRYLLMGIGGGPGEFFFPAQPATGLDGRPLGQRTAGPIQAPTAVTPGAGVRHPDQPGDPVRTWRRPT